MVSFWFFLLVLFLGFFYFLLEKSVSLLLFTPKRPYPRAGKEKNTYPEKPFPYTRKSLSPIPLRDLTPILRRDTTPKRYYPVSFRGTRLYPEKILPLYPEGVLYTTPKRYYPEKILPLYPGGVPGEALPGTGRIPSGRSSSGYWEKLLRILPLYEGSIPKR